ncbi:phosphatidate cytidylyltransferase [Niastella yeongjuensis]|uniref:Phosphatidate cytidylyltransferase n=1 Tax=Niastella yeongjuensis TaxID=354355 RepID=A0A1V9EX44_9BACT|nr:phosphatidate cytidylyltransferase [Niastella yeongjuensis]OQP50699.1 phosphatidate cytidylyltransferase [Niastella yeongjuensis]SEN22029.1 phosphatidate cytidylyltransferase [Niastella yeongjuensis]
MALNVKTLKTRSLTAAVFVVVMLTGLLWNHWSFFVLFSIVHFGCWAEYQKLIGLIDPDYTTITPFHKYGVKLAGWCVMLYFTNDQFSIFGLPLHEIGWFLGLLFIFILPIVELLFAKEIKPKNIGYSALGLVYISLSWGLMMDLRCSFIPQSREGVLINPDSWQKLMPIALIVSIWINDTMAYIVGSLIGKTPFSKISPKKTWEGTIGGAILCVVVIALLGNFTAPAYGHSVIHWIFIAAIAAVVGTGGDLLESKLKRVANVKDSGHIMPGHGGFLDRFDSLLLAIPFVWLYIQLALK